MAALKLSNRSAQGKAASMRTSAKYVAAAAGKLPIAPGPREPAAFWADVEVKASDNWRDFRTAAMKNAAKLNLADVEGYAGTIEAFGALLERVRADLDSIRANVAPGDSVDAEYLEMLARYETLASTFYARLRTSTTPPPVVAIWSMLARKYLDDLAANTANVRAAVYRGVGQRGSAQSDGDGGGALMLAAVAALLGFGGYAVYRAAR